MPPDVCTGSADDTTVGGWSLVAVAPSAADAPEHERQQPGKRSKLSDPEQEGPLEHLDAAVVNLAHQRDAKVCDFLREPTFESFQCQIHDAFAPFKRLLVEHIEQRIGRLIPEPAAKRRRDAVSMHTRINPFPTSLDDDDAIVRRASQL